jgi:hypothetical protein
MQVLFYNYHKSVAKRADTQNLIPYPTKPITQQSWCNRLKRKPLRRFFFNKQIINII